MPIGSPALGDRAAQALLLLVAGATGALVAACGGGTGPDGNGGGDTRTIELDLGPGEDRVVDGGGEKLTILLPPGEGDAEYRLAVHTVKENLGVTALRLTSSTADASASALRPSVGGTSWIAQELSSEDRALLLRHRIHENSRRLLQRLGIRPARPDGRGSSGLRTATLPTGETPQEGDTLEISYMVQSDLSISCDEDSATTITAVVKAVGDRAAMVEDTAVSDLASLSMDYASLADEFDTVVFGVDVAYFGDPTDIDGNDKVLVLFTPEVNKLTERGSESRIGGFFVAADLAESGDPEGDGTSAGGTCPASNESELLYLLAPDPDGSFSDTVEVESAKRNARGVSAHEFEHLLNAANRLFKGNGTFNDLEDTWLDEGLAHLAEEVAGFMKTGESLRANLRLSDVTETQAEVDAFNAFHIFNFLRLRRYLRDPPGTRTLTLTDPGGLESLKMRGFAWLFVRWLGDQEGPGGSGVLDGSREQDLFRGLAQADGGLSHGIQNVEEETGKTWPDLVSDFVAMPAVDDSAPASLSERLEHRTWHLPGVFRELHENEGSGNAFPEPYPLAVTKSGFVSRSFDVEVQAATARHLWFSAEGSTSDLSLDFRDVAGGPLPSDVRVTVVRIR